MNSESSTCISGETADPANIVIFGATGDLTKRKLMPSLVRMLRCGLVHPESRVIGVVNNRSEEEWLTLVRDGMREFSPEIGMNDERWREFSKILKMVPGDLQDETTFERLRDSLETLGGKKNAMFYCAIPPQWYHATAKGLHRVGLIDQTEGYRRIVIEKPLVWTSHPHAYSIVSFSQSSTNHRYTVLITILVKKVCKTCWCTVLPTASWSRCGTGITLTISRYSHPKPSVLNTGQSITRTRAHCVT